MIFQKRGGGSKAVSNFSKNSSDLVAGPFPKPSYNWFKIDILRLVQPLTAIFSPVQGHLNYYTHII